MKINRRRHYDDDDASDDDVANDDDDDTWKFLFLEGFDFVINFNVLNGKTWRQKLSFYFFITVPINQRYLLWFMKSLSIGLYIV